MQVLNLRTMKKCKAPSAVALGYFDALHKGHLSLLSAVCDGEGTPTVFTFVGDFLGEKKPGSKPLFDFEARCRQMESVGIQQVVTLVAGRSSFSLSPKAFLRLLTQKTRAKRLVCGEDFRFGKGACWGVEELSAYCKAHKIGLTVVPLSGMDEQKISSKAIRKAVVEGDMQTASALLGRPYSLHGRVEMGRKLGRRLGYPTANLPINPLLIVPAYGVYAASVCVDGVRYPAICNVGSHPTAQDLTHNVEVHLLGFEGDLYGRELWVELIEKLRDIMHFESLDALKEQLSLDSKEAIRLCEERV